MYSRLGCGPNRPSSCSCLVRGPRRWRPFWSKFARLALCGALLSVPSLAAPADAKGIKASAENKSTDPDENTIEITASSTRERPTAGSGFAIDAVVRNRSDKTVYLVGEYFILFIPPELDLGNQVYQWATIAGTGDTDARFKVVVALLPGASTVAHWTLTGRGESANWLTGWASYLLRLLGFVPAEYNLKIVGMYWLAEKDARDASKQATTARSQVAYLKAEVGTPQFVITVGAMVGGLLAYFLLPATRLHPGANTPTGILTALLLSATIAILLYRLADSPILIKVTVNDISGAIAIGFVGSASGAGILRRFAGRNPLPQATPPTSASPPEGAAS